MHIPVNVFLTNGVKLQGQIVRLNRKNGECEVERDGVRQLAMIHAIATVMPVSAEYNR